MISLFAIGVASYMSMSRGLSAEARMSRIEGALRQARNFAVRSGSFARVEIDREARTLTPVGFKTFGLWHLEDETGAFGRDLVIFEAEHMEGKIAQGLFLHGRADGKAAYAVYAGDRGLHAQEGVYVEAWVYPALSGQDQFIFRKKKDWDLKITRRGNLEGGGKDGDSRADTGDYVLPLHRWAKVALLVDGVRSQIYVDDILRAESAAGAKLPGGEEPFQIADASEPFVGIIDEVRLLAMVRGVPVVMPEGSELIPGPDAVHFDSQGELSPAHHGGEVELGFIHEGKRRSLRFGRLGGVRERKVETCEPAAGGGAPAGGAPGGGASATGGPG
jgi:hypothetical protein